MESWPLASSAPFLPGLPYRRGHGHPSGQRLRLPGRHHFAPLRLPAGEGHRQREGPADGSFQDEPSPGRVQSARGQGRSNRPRCSPKLLIVSCCREETATSGAGGKLSGWFKGVVEPENSRWLSLTHNFWLWEKWMRETMWWFRRPGRLWVDSQELSSNSSSWRSSVHGERRAFQGPHVRNRLHSTEFLWSGAPASCSLSSLFLGFDAEYVLNSLKRVCKKKMKASSLISRCK